MLKLSYYICLTLLVLGQFTVLSRFDGSGIYLFDIGVMLFAIFGLLYFTISVRALKIPGNFGYFSIFILLALISLVNSLFKFDFPDILPGSMYLARFTAYLLSGVVLYNMLTVGRITYREVFYSIIISGLVLSIGGFIQLFFLPDFTVLDPRLGWDPHKNRLASTFFDPNFTGAYLAVCLALMFNKHYNEKNMNFVDLLIFFIILVALFLTFSRSAWGMLAIIVFVFGYFKSKTLLYVSVLVAFCAYFAVPRVQTRISGATDPADSARLRISSWSNGLKIARDNLFLGVGFNNFKLAQKNEGLLEADAVTSHSASGTDSSLLLVLATTGIFGLLSYTLAFFYPVFGNQKFNILMLALTGGMILDSLFINSLFYPQIMFVLFSIHSFSRT